MKNTIKRLSIVLAIVYAIVSVYSFVTNTEMFSNFFFATQLSDFTQFFGFLVTVSAVIVAGVFIVNSEDVFVR